ncbi:MAG: protoporphyrinogen oxidase [Pseudonocardia sp.]|nr:protoporphyrinogen oxidase [Pseudonocardia sp.]
MVTTVLVAVAGKHGATAEIAGEIADVLRHELPAADVEVRDAADVGDLSRFDAVLVGSAIYMGRWLPAARHLVEHHRAPLAALPVWMFSSGPLGDPPRPLDDLAEVTSLGATITARGHQVFAGRLDPADLRWTERLAVRAVHSPTGDFRDHDAVRAWAVEVAAGIRAPVTGTFAPVPPLSTGESSIP